MNYKNTLISRDVTGGPCKKSGLVMGNNALNVDNFDTELRLGIQ